MMHHDYRNPVLRQLRDQQLDSAPRDQVLRVDRAERLISELDSAKTYTYAYLYGRIINRRPKKTAKLQVSGEVARHDLRLFVEDVTDAANVNADMANEPVWTVEDLSNRFKVSSKTISRWRRLGLVSRRFVFNGRKRVGFLQSSVDQFVQENEDRVRRGSAFSQLSAMEREEIIDRARRMVKAGSCFSDIARRLAEQLQRSVETIRYTIKHHDRKHPQQAIFPALTGALSDEAKKTIFQQYRGGASVEAIARQYCRTKASISRAVKEMRVRRILELPLDYIPNDSFSKPSEENKILALMPEDETKAKKPRSPSGLPPYLASLYEVPLLNREQERHLFRKFNFLKHQASQLREKYLNPQEKIDPSRAKVAILDRIERSYEQIVKIKNKIIRHNLRLVVSIAKRHVSAGENFFELVSDGNMSLIRAVEKFDYGRGFKFSTYASWAIMKNYARTIPLENRQHDRFRTSQAETFGAKEDARTNEGSLLIAQSQREDQVEKILRRLDEREQKIIVSRFGLGRDAEPLTLKQVGEAMGVTKERVRQIEARALNKLRLAAKEERIELCDLD